MLAVSLTGFDISELTDNYPSAAMFFVHYAGWVIAVMVLVMVIALWPAWTDSGWSMIRRLHFSLYALVLVLFVIQLWQWRIIGAAVI